MAINLNNIERPLPNISKTELKEVKGIILHSPIKYYGEKFTAYNSGYDEIMQLNRDTKDFGYHYGIDGNDMVEYIPTRYQAKSLTGNPTYISTALFKQKPEESCISICIFFSPENDYEEYEDMLIKLLVKLLREYDLDVTALWRGFDLCKTNKEPLIMLDDTIWKKYLNIIIKYLNVTDKSLTEREQAEEDDKV